MNFRIGALVTLAVALAALFVRLGLWQLDRLAERRGRNAELAARLAEPVATFEQLRDSLSYRRATVTGVPDYANEIVFTGRSRQGAPGVYVLTPIRRPDNDTAVLVIRGWVYAPDAATVDLPQWREARTTFRGYTLGLPVTMSSSLPRTNGRKLRALNTGGVQALVPYPVAARYLVSQDSTVAGAPARLPAPTLDNGPHLSYAIQWFAFAALAIGGAGIIVRRARQMQGLV